MGHFAQSPVPPCPARWKNGGRCLRRARPIRRNPLGGSIPINLGRYRRIISLEQVTCFAADQLKQGLEIALISQLASHLLQCFVFFQPAGDFSIAVAQLLTLLRRSSNERTLLIAVASCEVASRS